jgi:hypothetical protein
MRKLSTGIYGLKMRTLTLLAFSSFLLLSCQKEISYTDEPVVPTDTAALGRFVTATSITDVQLKASLDSLIINARNHGWWNLCNAIYPFVGGSAETCKYNLKDPRDDDAAYRITWHGNVTIDDGGGISTGGYGDTHIVPTSAFTLSSNHLSYYSTTDAFDTASVDAGCSDGVHDIQLRIYCGLNQGWYLAGISQAPYVTNQGLRGWFLGTRTGSSPSESALYKNGSRIGLGSANSMNVEGLPGSYSIALLNFNNAGIYTKSSNRKCAFATIGSGIDSAMAVQMYTDIQSFQTQLGREVY